MSQIPFQGETPSPTLATSATGTTQGTSLLTPAKEPALNLPPSTPTAPTLNPDHIAAVANAAPTLSPAETVAVAGSSSSMVDAGVRASAVQASQTGSKLTDLFHQLGDAQQTRLWAQIPDTFKSLMVGAGYRPPTSVPQAATGGFWHDAAHLLDNTRHAISTIGNVTKTTLVTDPGKLFNATMRPIGAGIEGAIANAKQAGINSYEQGGSFDSLSAIAQSLDPMSIIHAAASVYDGKTSFAPESLMYARRVLGLNQAQLQLAQTFAKGATLQQVLTSIPKDQRQNVALYVNQDANFKQAVSVLSDSGLSLGQVLFGGLNPSQMQKLFPRYSKGYFQANQAAAGALGAAGTVGMVASGDPEGLSAMFADGMTLRGGLALGGAGAQLTGTAAGILTGKTSDQATQMSPLGKAVNPLSGLTDGLVTWYANPLNRGIQFLHIAKDVERARVLMNAMGDSKNTEFLYTNSPNYVRWGKGFAQAVTRNADGGPGLSETPNIYELRHAGIKTDGNEELIKQYYPEIKAGVEAGTPEVGVAKMLGDTQGMVNMMRGRLANSFRDTGSLPYLTLRKDTVDRVLGIGKTTLQGDRFNVPKVGFVNSLKAIGAQQEINEARLLESADPTAHLGTMVRMGRRLTNEVAVGPMKLNDPKAVTIVENLARQFALPEKQVARYVNQYAMLGPDELPAKRQMVTTLILEGMHNLGVDATPAGEKWLNDMRDAQHYSTNGLDLIKDPSNPNGPAIPSAVLPSQTSDTIGLPDWAQVYHFARKSLLMKAFSVGLNNRGVDVFMSKFWKRSLLFRYAFGVRFASEEALNHVLRNGFASFAKARLAANVTHGGDAVRDRLLDAAGHVIQASKNEETRLWALNLADAAQLKELASNAESGNVTDINNLDSHMLAHALFGGVPTRWLHEALVGPGIRKIEGLQRMSPDLPVEQRLLATVAASRSINWLQKMEIKIAGEDVMNGSWELAKRGVLNTAYEDFIDPRTTHGNVFTGDNATAQTVHGLLKDADGKPLQLISNAGYEHVSVEDPEVIPKYRLALMQLGADHYAQAAARGITEGGYDQQIQNVEQLIKRPDLTNKIDEAQKMLSEAVGRGADAPTIDNLTGGLKTHQAAYDAHVTAMQRNALYHQNPDATATVKSGLMTQDEAIRGMAKSITDHTNSLILTEHPQEFTKPTTAGEEPTPIIPNGPQPIQMRPGVVPREPFRVQVGDNQYFTEEVHNTNNALKRVPKGKTALFRGMNTKTLTKVDDGLTNPALTWFARPEEAARRAGEDGTLYRVDVPNEVLATLKGDLQRTGHIELGKTHVAKTTNEIPNLLPDLIGRGIVPQESEFAKLPREVIPAEFVAPRLFASVSRANGGVINDFVEKGFKHLVGDPASYISRQPIFNFNYGRALKEARTGLVARGVSDFDGSLAHDIAMERAANDTIPFIHNPASKSQFSVITRNLLPFWFAQEQFYKRWGRLFATNPEAWYKLSMGMAGLSNSGFIYTDPYGQAAFAYPGSEFLLNLMNRTFGMGGPSGTGFYTEVNQLNPTTAMGGMPIPSLSPLVSIPVAWSAAAFPGLTPLAQGMQGPSAPAINQGGWLEGAIRSILPSVVNRGYDWSTIPQGQAGTNGIAAPIVMSSAATAARILEMAGQAPTDKALEGPNATLLQQQFMDRVLSWTKNIIGLRAVFGFFSPGTPNLQFADTPLANELQTYLSTMPYTEALATFVKLHPNALAEDAFLSTTDGSGIPGGGSGAYVPATARAVGYINANMDFFNTYPGLAPWTIPQNAAKGLFNATAYQEEKNLNIRSPRTLQNFYEQMKYAEASNIYYPTETLFKASEGDAESLQSLGITQSEAMSQLGIPANYSTSQIKQIWSKWSGDFQNTHPVFKAQIATRGVESAQRRASIVGQLQSAISSGGLPENEWTKAIGPLMKGFDEVQNFANASKGNTGDSSQRVDNYNAFISWGNAYIKAYPVLGQFWNGVLLKAVPK